jgi:hypothetical protein
MTMASPLCVLNLVVVDSLYVNASSCAGDYTYVFSSYASVLSTSVYKCSSVCCAVQSGDVKYVRHIYLSIDFSVELDLVGVSIEVV